MPPKQRQVRVQQQSALASMQELEKRSDEELEREQRNKAAAYAILGARAAERYDAKTAREWFRKAVAAARPQERMALRRMADASLALAERRADDLKVAVERLGQAPPSNRQLLLLRITSILIPPPGAGAVARVRGIVLILLAIVAILAIATGIVLLIGLPFGGVSVLTASWLGILLALVALGVLIWLGRRRQAAARAKQADAMAARR
ncbi:hypothetical protein [Conexibacter sp. SYSU D00693]|uniref:hypothetical protein n=1 Tax=Conexibacter sp. SYSU D00693 TaxID=2812560 RepID=UPI00196A3BD1|nr:hypothetical protein [Conexibacter sp. SYSU D00693]